MKPKQRGQNWRQKLPRPIVIRDGKTLTILGDCRSYVLSLPEGDQTTVPWQHAATLMLTASEGGSLEDVVMQFERILIHQNNLRLS